MIEQKEKGYTMITPGGVEMPVIHMSKEDIERELAAFEAKYGMSSQEFIIKYHSRGFEEENLEFMDWEWYYYAACEGIYSWKGD